ncbi:MAG: hypothetical protein N2114_06215, partial [Candidatus Goldbacteria bacterium]|nr:hypothetical protein [Candidatus Goldiibacteriota bacterium]
PNPYFFKTPVAIDFYLTKPAEIIYFRLYTVAGRLIREVPHSKSSPYIINGLLQGKNTLQITQSHLEDLAMGIYYYVLVAEDNTKKQVKSMVEKLVVIK